MITYPNTLHTEIRREVQMMWGCLLLEMRRNSYSIVHCGEKSSNISSFNLAIHLVRRRTANGLLFRCFFISTLHSQVSFDLNSSFSSFSSLFSRRSSFSSLFSRRSASISTFHCLFASSCTCLRSKPSTLVHL